MRNGLPITLHDLRDSQTVVVVRNACAISRHMTVKKAARVRRAAKSPNMYIRDLLGDGERLFTYRDKVMGGRCAVVLSLLVSNG